MKNKQNLHTHTNFADGKNSPEEIVLEAIKKGFDSLGFSEHSYLEDSLYPHQMTPNDMEIYKKDISLLKEKYEDKIEIFCGLEYDYFSNVSLDGFDYLIGSVHYLNANNTIKTFDNSLNDTMSYIEENFNGNGLKFAENYFQTVSLLPKKGSFDIIGHFDLISKNNEKGNFFDIFSKEYLNLGFEAIHSLKDKIPFFEVNTGAISRGYKSSPYPQLDFLKEFKKCGFGAIITSDCHDKSFLDCSFLEAKELLKTAGFKTKWILTRNGFKEVSI